MRQHFLRDIRTTIIILLFGFLSVNVILAQTINVEGNCNLVDAITAANTDQSVGGCSAGSGDDVIELLEDITLTEIDNDSIGDSGLPVIVTNMTINGNGFTVQRAANAPEFRIFSHTAGDLVINDLTISGGFTSGEEGQEGRGGGIFSFIQFTAASLSINNSIITNNQASYIGGGIAVFNAWSNPEAINDFLLTIDSSQILGNSSSIGGGLRTTGSGIIGIITNSRISSNEATNIGGGIYNGFGTPKLEIFNTTISENTAKKGSAIFNDSSTDGTENFEAELSLSNSYISNNFVIKADSNWISSTTTITNSGIMTISQSHVIENEGVGIESGNALSTSIIDSTIANNIGVGVQSYYTTVFLDASTIYNNSNGGFYIASNSEVTIVNSTIYANTREEGDGAGINIQNTNGNPAQVNIINSSIVGNRVAEGRWGHGIDNYGYNEVSIINSILWNDDVRDCTHFSAGNYTGRNNRSNNSECPGSSIIQGVDEILQDNGGPTKSLALLEGSNAIDAGDPLACPATDQRGAQRVGVCDIGAFEYGGQVDTDHDGYFDNEDMCVMVANSDQSDSDNDGVGDACDECAGEAGSTLTMGCPDEDTDGFANAVDNCPSVANAEQMDFNSDGLGDACQDSDNDSFSDAADKCPSEAGTVNGCLDSDGDLVGDGEDTCPNVAGSVSANGCPDRDEDTVTDADDQCPDEAGLVETRGCIFTGTVNSTKNLRGGPGTDFGIVGTVENGDIFILVGRNESSDWLLIQLSLAGEESTQAWIAASLVLTEADLSLLPVVVQP